MLRTCQATSNGRSRGRRPGLRFLGQLRVRGHQGWSQLGAGEAPPLLPQRGAPLARATSTSSRNAPTGQNARSSGPRGGSPSQPWRQIAARPSLGSGSSGQFGDTAAPAVQPTSPGGRALGLPAPLLPAGALPGSPSVRRGELAFGLQATSPRTPRGPVLPRSQCFGRIGGHRLLPRTGCRPGAGRALRPLPASRRALAQDRRPAVPPRSASSRQRVRPRLPHWLRAPQPAIGPRSLFYIGRPGPIGVRHLLNMHAGHQSASAGAGPPRAVAKLGLLNCY